MKTINPRPAYLFLFIALLATSSSCKKDATTASSSANAASRENSTSETQTLDLRPGPDAGQDAYVAWKFNHPIYANSNNNAIPELVATAWTDGVDVMERFFIRFDSLAKIPHNAKVISARLYLHGLSSSLNMLRGNSYYIGSSDPLTNPCYVSVVKPNQPRWDESTITWNNQPAVSRFGHVMFGPSTAEWNWDTEIDVTQMVTGMVKFPAYNNGFRVSLVTEEKYRAIVFGSSEAADENDRPRLVVQYMLP